MIPTREKLVAVAHVSRDDLITSMANSSLPTLLEGVNTNAFEDIGRELAALHKSRVADVIGYFAGLSWEGLTHQQSFKIEEVLSYFGGYLGEDVEDVFRFFQTVAAAARRGATYKLERAFETWCEVNPNLLGSFLERLEHSDTPGPYLHILLGKFRADFPDDAFSACMRLTRDARGDIRRQAIYALGGFNYGTAGDAALARSRVIEIMGANEPDDRRSAIFAACSLARQPETATADLVSALQSQAQYADPESREMLLSGLLSAPKVLPETLKTTLVGLVAQVQLAEERDVSLLNQWLYHTNLDTARDSVLDVLNAVISSSARGWSFEGLHGFRYRVMQQSQDLLGWYAIRWLLNPSQDAAKNLHQLFQPLDHGLYNFKLDRQDLSEPDVFYLARKVFVHLIYAHGPAVSFLCAFLLHLPSKPRRALEQEIAAFWLRNFPADLELFDAHCVQFPAHGLAASVKRMRRISEEYFKPLKSLPRNAAMRPSSQERRVQQEIAHERSKEIRRAADEGSILPSIVHKSTLLYGRSSVTYLHGDDVDQPPIRQVIPLQHFEASLEMPAMDVLAPAYLNHLLHRFRSEPRPK